MSLILLSCGYFIKINKSGDNSMKYEKLINEYNNFFCKGTSYSHELIRGVGNVMVSAPHSVAQTRNGAIKTPERHTGIIAKILHDELNCPIIYKTKNCGDDANYDDISDYRNDLVRYIKENNINFLVDLHQLSSIREVQINIGTGQFKNISNIEQINVFLKEFTVRNIGIIQIDYPFKASFQNTVSASIAKECNIPSVQLEINSDLLITESRAINESFMKVYDALKNIIIEFQK